MLIDSEEPGYRRITIPAVLGAGFYGILFLYCLIVHGRFSIMGVRDERLSRIIDVLKKDFLGRITLEIIGILLAYLIIGALLALFFSAWSKRARVFMPLLILAHCLFLIRAMIRWPQLFAEFWYNPGGRLADLMRFFTDRVSPAIPETLLIILFGLTAIRALFVIPRTAKIALSLAIVICGPLYLLSFHFSARPNKGPNLLIILMDSLRADRLSVFGYQRLTTPAIDALAHNSLCFNKIYIPLPRTFQSWASLLTGKWPPSHGIRTMFPTFEERAMMGRTMMHDLADAGWRTSVISDFAGDIFPRADFGFQEIRAPNFNIFTLAQLRLMEIQQHLLPYLMNNTGRTFFPILKEFAHGADPELLGNEVIDTIAESSHKDRFAVAVFFSATHFPYAAPYPYYKLFTNPAYRGPFKYHKFYALTGDEKVTKTDEQHISAIYDGAVRATDAQVWRIMQYLQKSGLAQNTIVVISGDHGEDIYDRPDLGMNHGNHLRGHYSSTVPLIIFDPRKNWPVHYITSRLRQIDMAPTLLALMGRSPMPGMEGENLLPYILGDKTEDLPVYQETGLWYTDEGDSFYQHYRIHYPDVTEICEPDKAIGHQIVIRRMWQEVTNAAKHRVWINENWKLIVMPTHHGLRYELYDLYKDPDERNDVAILYPQIVATLSHQMRNFLEERSRYAPLEAAILAENP